MASLLRAIRTGGPGQLGPGRGAILYARGIIRAELLACRTYTLGVVRYTASRCIPGYTLLKLNNNMCMCMPLCSEASVGRRAERANRTSDNESEGTPLTAS